MDKNRNIIKSEKTGRSKLPVRKKTALPVKESDIIKSDDIVRIKGGMDRTFLIIVIVMICYGSVMVFSASYAYSLAKYDNSYYFIERQLIYAALGIGVMIFVANFIDYSLIKKWTKVYFIVNIILLIVVLFVGNAAGEARRWISIPGTSFNLQPSELMKLGIVLYLAKFLSDNQDKATNTKSKIEPLKYGLIKPMVTVILVCALVALEKHFSCIIILFLIGVCVVFAAGGNMKWLAGSGVVFGIGAFIAIMFVDYAKKRVDMWLNPENFSQQADTWQTIQGVKAVGSGGIFGVGLGQSMQKHMFVSQPQNDFIFAIICEELGFIGAILTIALFVAFVWRGFVIATKAPDVYSKLVVVGIVSKVAIQAIFNMAVVTASMPNTGVSLPFFSYGGSSLVILLGEMGIILSISKYSTYKKT